MTAAIELFRPGIAAQFAADLTRLGTSRDATLESHFDEPTLIFRQHSKTEAV
jgi:hypothetical protein